MLQTSILIWPPCLILCWFWIFSIWGGQVGSIQIWWLRNSLATFRKSSGHRPSNCNLIINIGAFGSAWDLPHFRKRCAFSRARMSSKLILSVIHHPAKRRVTQKVPLLWLFERNPTSGWRWNNFMAKMRSFFDNPRVLISLHEENLPRVRREVQRWPVP